jgi:hypothetical protein
MTEHFTAFPKEIKLIEQPYDMYLGRILSQQFDPVHFALLRKL